MADFEFSAPDWTDGVKVSVYPRTSDSFVPTSINAAATGTIKDGTVTFKNLDDDAPYWAVGEIEVQEPNPGAQPGDRTVKQRRAVMFTAVRQEFLDLSPEVRNDRAHTTAQHLAQTDAAAKKFAEVQQKDPTGVSAAPGERTQHNTIKGARGSRAGRELLSGTSSDTDPADETRVVHSGEKLPDRLLNQRDVENTWQRSDTALGQATPKDDPKADGPAQQADVKKSTWQRSDTPEGEATPKKPRSLDEPVPQEKAKGPQRSDTPEGTAAPKPEQKQARPRARTTKPARKAGSKSGKSAK